MHSPISFPVQWFIFMHIFEPHVSTPVEKSWAYSGCWSFYRTLQITGCFPLPCDETRLCLPSCSSSCISLCPLSLQADWHIRATGVFFKCPSDPVTCCPSSRSFHSHVKLKFLPPSPGSSFRYSSHGDTGVSVPRTCQPWSFLKTCWSLAEIAILPWGGGHSQTCYVSACTSPPPKNPSLVTPVCTMIFKHP